MAGPSAIIEHRSNHLTDILTATKSAHLSYLFYSTVFITTLFWLYRSIINDYYGFLALGPGGTPSTFAGYLRVSYLRLFILKDPFQPPSFAKATFPSSGYLRQLTRRSGRRPETAGIAPHRQLNQKCSAPLHHCIRGALYSLAAAYPSLLRKGNSCFEKHGLALFLSACSHSALANMPPHPAPSHLNPTCANTGEICHLHATDSSMHLTLHPLDAALVLHAGWGERHPLAGISIHGKRLLPPGFIMVYAPREEAEVQTVMEIVKAGAWWVGGVDLGLDKALGGIGLGMSKRLGRIQ